MREALKPPPGWGAIEESDETKRELLRQCGETHVASMSDGLSKAAFCRTVRGTWHVSACGHDGRRVSDATMEKLRRVLPGVELVESNLIPKYPVRNLRERSDVAE